MLKINGGSERSPRVPTRARPRIAGLAYVAPAQMYLAHRVVDGGAEGNPPQRT